jgi:CheY-like chemotaxis protein
MDIIEHSGEHLLGLINEVLDLAKVEAGTLELRPTNFHLPRLLENVSDIMRTRAQAKGLAFSSEWLTELPLMVRADERRIRQVLMNLLDNAIKYTQEGGVTLKVGHHDTRLRFMVEDTGVGIHPENLQDIFNIFHQIRSHTAFEEGTGLGLAICKRLVGLMGGRLQVTSIPGEGSRFWFDLILPTVTVETMTSESREREVVAVKGDKRRVLIADDQVDNRNLLRDMLVPLGFEVYEASDGLSCLNQAMAVHPDVLLVDLRMPVLRGEEVIQRLRNTQEFRNLAIIAISASAFEHDRERCIGAGANDFLPKPFRLTKLLELLHRYLKLELIFATDESEAESAQPQGNEDGPVVLPTKRWKILVELAKRGDIRNLREQAEQLSQLDTRYTPFAQELCAMADGFQVKKIRQILAGTQHKS